MLPYCHSDDDGDDDDDDDDDDEDEHDASGGCDDHSEGDSSDTIWKLPQPAAWKILMEGSLQGTHRYYRIYIYISLSLSLRVCVFESTDYNIYNYKTIMSFYFTTATPTHKLVMFTNFVI